MRFPSRMDFVILFMSALNLFSEYLEKSNSAMNLLFICSLDFGFYGQRVDSIYVIRSSLQSNLS